jgi:hypothetical protein
MCLRLFRLDRREHEQDQRLIGKNIPGALAKVLGRAQDLTPLEP